LANSVDDDVQELALRDLHTYFFNNTDGLISCNQREIELPKPQNGKEYRTCGAMEGNVFSIIGNRMKGRRRCWSIRGGNNLARLLCLKSTHKLNNAISMLGRHMPEKYAEEVITAFSPTKQKRVLAMDMTVLQKVLFLKIYRGLNEMVEIKSFYDFQMKKYAKYRVLWFAKLLPTFTLHIPQSIFT